MATRSNIAVKVFSEKPDDCLYRYVYCHWDGYPSHHMPILEGFYNTYEKALALVEMGDISVLDNSIEKPEGEHSIDGKRQEGYSLFYSRDRGETQVQTRNAFTVKEMKQEEYLYVFEDGKGWSYWEV